ncbi:MAG: carbohydrate ABC transporter permease [Spirochaetaceae bacterium]|nr:carbohydrate ABC transporter permease [Spirochaetaceae bacterium]
MKKTGFFNIINYSLITLFSLFCALPLVLLFMVSLTDEKSIIKNGYQLLPEQFSLEAYKMIFTGGHDIFNSYLVTIFVTVAGTLIAVMITAMAAYTLANKNVSHRNTLSLFFFFTMVFNGGIVPWYIICVKLGLRNNILALIIPSLLFNPFNLFLVRNYMNGIPDSLRESALIDGAGDIRIAFQIYLPLSTPVLAAVSLFYGLAYWNNWWNAIMLVEKKNLYPLQYFLLKLKSELTMLTDLQGSSAVLSTITMPTESLKMATAIITIGPIILLYPYLQRYFVKGLMIGSIKG